MAWNIDESCTKFHSLNLYDGDAYIACCSEKAVQIYGASFSVKNELTNWQDQDTDKHGKTISWQVGLTNILSFNSTWACE